MIIEETELIVRTQTRLIDSAGICAEYGIAPSTQRELRRSGNFPPALRLGQRKLFFRREALEAWLDSRTEARPQQEAEALAGPGGGTAPMND